MTDAKTWKAAFERIVSADVDVIWAALSNVETWKAWNSGVSDVQIDGPFRAGSSFRMTLPDGPTLESKLVEVEAPRLFTDETWLDGTVVRVVHQVEAIRPGQSRVTFHVQAEGDNAEHFGPMASADFPDVLAGLGCFVGSGERGGA